MKKHAFRLTAAAILLTMAAGQAVPQQLGSKVYWMATVEVPIGKLAEYHEFAENVMVPLQEQHGYHIVAAWQTIVGDIQEGIMVAEFASMADYHKARVSLVTSEEWKKAAVQFDALTNNVKSRFLSALPYSRMK